MTELDGAERLDPALRAIATTRTNFSLRAIKLMREPFNDRRREAAALTDVSGLRIADDMAQAEAASVPVRVYRGGQTAPAPVVVCWHARGIAVGNLDTAHPQCAG